MSPADAFFSFSATSRYCAPGMMSPRAARLFLVALNSGKSISHNFMKVLRVTPISPSLVRCFQNDSGLDSPKSISQYFLIISFCSSERKSADISRRSFTLRNNSEGSTRYLSTSLKSLMSISPQNTKRSKSSIVDSELSPWNIFRYSSYMVNSTS